MAKSKKKTFLAVYLGSKASMKKWEKLPEKVRHEREALGMKAWHEWARKNQKAIIYDGGPLGVTKHVSSRGVKNSQNELCAYTVVTASSHAAAANIFKKHPHFSIFPGDAVEIMECLDIPGI